MKRSSVWFISIALAGCSSFNDSEQSVLINTQTEKGTVITGANCQVHNDKGLSTTVSGSRVLVRRSNEDLEILCKLDGQPQAKAHVESSSNAGLWGDILLGSPIGIISDHNSGKGYAYPEEITLVFGKVVTID